MKTFKESLPIDSILPKLVSALKTSPTVVVQAPPGAGKTTRVPLALLPDKMKAGKTTKAGQIWLLEPRRLAARACADAMARLLGEQTGETIGYKVRFDSKVSEQTRIVVVTEGILTRRYLTDPFLEGISHIILDEFHERSVHTDLCLAFTKELLTVRDDLKLIVMSATLDTKQISDYLNNCPIFETKGRAYPLEVAHVPVPDDRPLPKRVVSGVMSVLARNQTTDDKGDILVFLPGAGEIKQTARLLAAKTAGAKDIKIVPLYGGLPKAAQDAALTVDASQRIVLATNIAETSLTIPGVTAVIDSGLVKTPKYDPVSGLSKLVLTDASEQSVAQRSGRAGRIAPGYALRLWPRTLNRGRPKITVPEIRQTDPASFLLSVLSFAPKDPETFDFFEKPDTGALKEGLLLLRQLGALPNQGFNLTPMGEILAQLPVHPRLGMILIKGASKGQLTAAALFAAIVEEREVLTRETQDMRIEVDCDVAYRAEHIEGFAKDGATKADAAKWGLVFSVAKAILQAQKQYISIGKRLLKKTNLFSKTSANTISDTSFGTSSSTRSGFGARSSMGRFSSDSLDSAVLLAGFPDRVCVRRPQKPDEGLMVGGQGVWVAPQSGVKKETLFLAINAMATDHRRGSKARVTMASSISLQDLKDLGPSRVQTQVEPRFDNKKEAVFMVEAVVFDGLTITEKSTSKKDDHACARLLSKKAAKQFKTIFKPDKNGLALIHRIQFAQQLFSSKAWPNVTEEGLTDILEEICQGKSTFEQLRKVNWETEINNKLGYDLKRQLDMQVPEGLKVPSGRHITLDYSNARYCKAQSDGDTDIRGPVLAVRLQELFGLTETPRIGNGKVPVTVHLLGPNYRPVQVTTDLANFWRQTYHDVRKQLRARYPKHHWPENPLEAIPTARAKPRKKQP